MNQSSFVAKDNKPKSLIGEHLIGRPLLRRNCEFAQAPMRQLRKIANGSSLAGLGGFQRRPL